MRNDKSNFYLHLRREMQFLGLYRSNLQGLHPGAARSCKNDIQVKSGGTRHVAGSSIDIAEEKFENVIPMDVKSGFSTPCRLSALS